jgi:TetR/AcrR family transcriptional regulator, transcriptional repressor for nem operon
MESPRRSPPADARTRLLDSAIQLIRERGYADSSVEELCTRAGVTKGSLFHHFKTKDDLAIGAMDRWNRLCSAMFADAAYNRLKDPLERLFGYLDFRETLLQKEGVSAYACLFGTVVQEVYATHPALLAASSQALDRSVASIVHDVAAAKKLYAPGARWSAQSLACFIQAELQGSFLFAKARQGPEVIKANIEHLRGYLRLLFGDPPTKRRQH